MTTTKETTEDFFFTCKDCGAHALEVSRQYWLVRYFEETISCECGAADEGIATRREVRVTHAMHAWGPLEDDHHFTFDEQEEEEVEREVLEHEIFCHACTETADAYCWSSTEIEVTEEDDEWYVHCSGCGRDIEFGWSHPDRGGRIWTAEDVDFNPWKTFPEPRYRASWGQKGWLRPQT
jgi:hypothetical protein